MIDNDKVPHVQDIWRGIEAWLSNYAPHTWQKLRPGASEWEIQKAEATLGVTLPDTFKASYRIHDGGFVMNLVTEMTIFSLEQALAEWHMFMELDDMGTWINAGTPYYFTERVIHSGWQSRSIQPVWWDYHWIPFGRDRAGNHCCLDLHPADGGEVGQIIDRDHEAGPSRVLAPSFLEVLSTFANDLEAGRYVDTQTGLIIRD
jgi:cell wall assembly regulator SMI1